MNPVNTESRWWGKGERPQVEDTAIRPFKIEVPQQVLDDLASRLERSRLPPAFPDDKWRYGFNMALLPDLVEYWRTKYDWRAHEARLNTIPQFKTNIDGIDVHFMHAKSSDPNATPIIFSHGWPGSVWEFESIIPLLTKASKPGDPTFHVVAPSLPGFGFSSQAERPGMNILQTSIIFSKLMKRLGYSQYIAQGGDWGSYVSSAMPLVDKENLLGLHLNMLYVERMVPDDSGTIGEAANDDQKNEVADTQNTKKAWAYEAQGYFHQQSTKPHTLGIGLSDSPVGLAAWILEKFQGWTGVGWRGGSTTVFAGSETGWDELLTNVMIYWVTNTINSSCRYYRENSLQVVNANPEVATVYLAPVTCPTGAAIFPDEPLFSPRSSVELKFKNLLTYNVYPKGGHFAAREQPKYLAESIREFHAALLQDKLAKTKL